MGYVLAGLLAMGAAYLFGGMPVTVKTAAVYVGSGSWREHCFGASFTRCSGRIHRILRVKESRSYSFRLSGHVQQGSVRAMLTANGVPVLTLGGECPTATVFLQRGKFYRLTLRFQFASGDYQLEWD